MIRLLGSVVLLAAAASGCSDDATSSPARVLDAGEETDGGALDSAIADGAAKEAAFAAIDAIVERARAAKGAPSLGLSVYDRKDALVYRKMYGDFASDRIVAVASASKWVSGLALLALVGKGQLSLDATTGTVLGWSGAKASITLRHLLSFTSGLTPTALCAYNSATTLSACVDVIAGTEPVAAPGARFDYGPTHLHVAARMAEIVTGKPWATLFDETLRQPLGLAPDVAYFTSPREAKGTANPLIAGGMRASMDEYAKVLGLVFRKGTTVAGTLVVPPELISTQTIEPYPAVTIGYSPMADAGYPWRYGLAAWLECGAPATGCSAISSPGAFGFTPWLDRDAGYYAILGMQADGIEGGVPTFAVALEQELKPAIVAALASQ